MKSLIFVSLLRGGAIILQFIYIRLIARFLASDELGYYYMFAAIIYFFNALIFLPIDQYQQVKARVFFKNEKTLKSILNFNIKIGGRFFLFFFIISFGASIFTIDSAIVTLLIGFNSITLYFMTLQRNLIANFDFQIEASLLNLADPFFKSISAYVCFFFKETSAVGLCGANLASAILLVLIGHGICNRLRFFKFQNSEEIKIKPALKFIWPISIGALLNWVNLQAYRLVLVPFGFSESVGTYTITSNIGSAGMGACASVFSQLTNPKIYKSGGGAIYKYLGIGLLLGISITLLAWIISPLLVKLILGDKFITFSATIVFGVLVTLCNMLTGSIGICFNLVNRNSALLISSVIGAFLAIAGFAALFILEIITPLAIGIVLSLSQMIAFVFLFFTLKYSDA